MFTVVINGNPHPLTLANIPKKPFHILALLDASTRVQVMCVNAEYKKKLLQRMLTMFQDVPETLSCPHD